MYVVNVCIHWQLLTVDEVVPQRTLYRGMNTPNDSTSRREVISSGWIADPLDDGAVGTLTTRLRELSPNVHRHAGNLDVEGLPRFDGEPLFQTSGPRIWHRSPTTMSFLAGSGRKTLSCTRLPTPLEPHLVGRKLASKALTLTFLLSRSFKKLKCLYSWVCADKSDDEERLESGVPEVAWFCLL